MHIKDITVECDRLGDDWFVVVCSCGKYRPRRYFPTWGQANRAWSNHVSATENAQIQRGYRVGAVIRDEAVDLSNWPVLSTEQAQRFADEAFERTAHSLELSTDELRGFADQLGATAWPTERLTADPGWAAGVPGEYSFSTASPVVQNSTLVTTDVGQSWQVYVDSQDGTWMERWVR